MQGLHADGDDSAETQPRMNTGDLLHCSYYLLTSASVYSADEQTSVLLFLCHDWEWLSITVGFCLLRLHFIKHAQHVSSSSRSARMKRL